MTREQYMTKLAWDQNKFQLMLAEECQHLKDKPGSPNHMYKIAEPMAKAAFGNGAMIVNKEWAAKHTEATVTQETQAVPEVEQPKPIPAIPEAPKRSEIPAAEVKEAVEPPSPPAKEETPKEEEKPIQVKEWPGFVKSRVANLTGTGKWKYEGEDTLKNEELKMTISYQEIEDMENKDWTDLLKDTQGTKEETPKPEPDNSRKRLEFLVKNGCEEHDMDDAPGIVTPDGKIFTQVELGKMSSEDWMALTVKYSAFNVRKLKEQIAAEQEHERKAEQAYEEQGERDHAAKQEREDSAVDAYEAKQKEEKKPEPKKEESFEKEKADKEEALAEQTKARRWALQSIGWTESKTKGYIIGPGGPLRYQEVLDMPEVEFKNLLEVPVKVEKSQEEISKEISEKNELQLRNSREPEKVETSEKAKEEVRQQSVLKKRYEADKALGKTDPSDEAVEKREPFQIPSADKSLRDNMAFDILLKVITPTSDPKTLAEFAYEVADQMLKLKK